MTQNSNGYVLQISDNTLTLNSVEYIQDNNPNSAIVNLSDLYQQINTTENNPPSNDLSYFASTLEEVLFLI